MVTKILLVFALLFCTQASDLTSMALLLFKGYKDELKLVSQQYKAWSVPSGLALLCILVAKANRCYPELGKCEFFPANPGVLTNFLP